MLWVLTGSALPWRFKVPTFSEISKNLIWISLLSEAVVILWMVLLHFSFPHNKYYTINIVLYFEPVREVSNISHQKQQKTRNC